MVQITAEIIVRVQRDKNFFCDIICDIIYDKQPMVCLDNLLYFSQFIYDRLYDIILCQCSFLGRFLGRLLGRLLSTFLRTCLRSTLRSTLRSVWPPVRLPFSNILCELVGEPLCEPLCELSP